MRKTMRVMRRSILPAGFALSLASSLLLIFCVSQVASYSKSLANVNAVVPSSVRMLGLGLALIGFLATFAGVVSSKRYRSFQWIALACAGVFFLAWFVMAVVGS
jgi:threonine/homoserine efflux transporter RhtA